MPAGAETACVHDPKAIGPFRACTVRGRLTFAFVTPGLLGFLINDGPEDPSWTPRPTLAWGGVA